MLRAGDVISAQNIQWGLLWWLFVGKENNNGSVLGNYIEESQFIYLIWTKI